MENRMKKTLLISLLFALALTATLAVTHAQSDAILLVTPARYSVMQVAFDVARRYPTVLVSYQGNPQEPTLHVWNGYEWMPLSNDDYLSGAFLQTNPGRAIFLGDNALLPASLQNIQSWCSQSIQLGGLETHDLVNGIGAYLPFTPADWRWFAGRYNLTLSNLKAAEAEAAREQSWYKESGPVKDAPPSFFRYFTRSRKGRAVDTTPAIEPVQVPSSEPDVSSAP